MQKLALKEYLVDFNNSVLSNEIIDLVSKFRDANPGQFRILKDELIQYIVKSKSNYDNLIKRDSNLKLISDAIDTEVFEPENISKLVSTISSSTHNAKVNLLSNKFFIDFHIFHQSLLNTNNITQVTIKESQICEDAIIFTLISDNEPVVRDIIRALTIIQELVNITEKIYDEEVESENIVYLLDKGSNTNIGLKTGINTARSLFQIFKEVWDWVVNRRYYKEKLRNASFLDNMEVITKIHAMEEAGALKNEDAKRYKELIIRKTDELISHNAIPRKILLDEKSGEKNRLLIDYNEVRLLKDENN